MGLFQPERWKRSENLKAVASFIQGLVIYGAIAIFATFMHCAYQFNNAFAVAFILSGVLLIKNKNQTKEINCTIKPPCM